MHIYKVYFRKNKLEYCGGQNNSNSRKFMLWVNEWRGKEFKYWIGNIDNKTNKFIPDENYDNLPEEIKNNKDALIKLATS